MRLILILPKALFLLLKFAIKTLLFITSPLAQAIFFTAKTLIQALFFIATPLAKALLFTTKGFALALVFIAMALFNVVQGLFSWLSHGISKLKGAFVHDVPVINNEANNQNVAGEGVWQEINGDLIDVVIPQNNNVVAHNNQDVFGLFDSDKQLELNLLSEEEKKSIKEMILNHNKEPMLDRLITRWERYSTLLENLEKVQEALNNNKNPENERIEIEDQVIAYMEVEIPMLLVKQYHEKENKWKVVPANSYITNKDTLVLGLNQNQKHPINRDNIYKPSSYEDKPTRYKWYEITANAFYAQELAEGAEEIRTLLFKLQNKSQVSLSNSLSQTLLGVSSIKNNLNDENKIENRFMF
ncbi:MAG: hypothetical protein HYX60_12235 [Legionella longbeachae]|nr:hypothetical protein [Legionella longbeachae]